MIQIHPPHNILLQYQTEHHSNHFSTKSRMEQFEEEFMNRGGDRAQFHNIYKVPLVAGIQSLQVETSKELARVSSKYDFLISKKVEEISEMNMRKGAIKSSPINATELDSSTIERELQQLIDTKKTTALSSST